MAPRQRRQIVILLVAKRI